VSTGLKGCGWERCALLPHLGQLDYACRREKGPGSICCSRPLEVHFVPTWWLEGIFCFDAVIFGDGGGHEFFDVLDFSVFVVDPPAGTENVA
jgi:hypothetical protein